MSQTKRQRKRLEWVRFLDKAFKTKFSRQLVKEAEARDRRIEKGKSIPPALINSKPAPAGEGEVPNV